MSGGIPSWAVKGAKVVRVMDWYALGMTPHPALVGAHDDPALGYVYTIEDVYLDESISDYGVYIWLVECRSGEYAIELFRPAVPSKSEAEDLAQFLPLLKPQKLRERA